MKYHQPIQQELLNVEQLIEMNSENSLPSRDLEYEWEEENLFLTEQEEEDLIADFLKESGIR